MKYVYGGGHKNFTEPIGSGRSGATVQEEDTLIFSDSFLTDPSTAGWVLDGFSWSSITHTIGIS